MAISNNSTGLRTGVCTSTTRPTAPYEGQHIYETDTDIEYVWNGSAWVVNYVSANSPAFTGTPTAPTASAGTNSTQIATMASKPWNVPWGMMAAVRSVGAYAVPANSTPISFVGTPTFTPVAGRLYKLVWSIGEFTKLKASYNQDIHIRVNNGSGTIVDHTYYSALAAATYGSPSRTTYITSTELGTTSPIILVMMVSTNGADSDVLFGSDANSPTILAIEDVGPTDNFLKV